MAANLIVAFSPSPVGAGTRLAVQATPQLSQGVSRPSEGLYRFISRTAVNGVSPLAIRAPYVAMYGELITGRKIFFRIALYDQTGRRSAWFYTSKVVA